MATNQQEGPHTRNVPGHTEQTCSGCKHHGANMVRSGREPIYHHYCLFPNAAPALPFIPYDQTRDARFIGRDSVTPDWCPVINKESEESE